jgi:hypothetical protein
MNVNMKRNAIGLLLMTATLIPLLQGCEEPYEFDPQDIEVRLVVEASLSEGSEPDWVILRESGPLSPSEPYSMVSDALVSIRKDSESYAGSPVGEGVYAFPGLEPEAGQSYDLRIERGAEAWEASSYMPLPVVPDSFSFQYTPATLLRGEGYLMRAHIAALPPGTCLRFKVFKDGAMLPEYFLYDGNPGRNEPGTYAFRTYAFQAGDSLRIQTQAMDKSSYLYYSQLADLSGSGFGPGAAAPANPVGNLSGDALGVFAAVALHEQTVVVE